MKQLAFALVSVATLGLATPALACPHSDEAPATKTVQKDEQKAPDTKTAKTPTKTPAQAPAKTDDAKTKTPDKVSSR